MGAPTVPYKIMAKGYRLRTDSDGIHATVPVLVNWSDAFTFHDTVLGFPTATTAGGNIIYSLPWQFPASRAPIYAVSMDIEPIGASGELLGPTFGLGPGEFFSNALCTVEFRSRGFMQQASDDPNGINQLDPNEPILFCDQSVKGGAKMISVPGFGYLFDDGTPVLGDFGFLQPEARLTLTYPWVPYLPWQRISSLLGSLNTATMFGCAKGALMFEDFDTKQQITNQGLQGQSVTYVLAYQGRDWNMLPKPDGSFSLVKQKGNPSNRIYPYNDLTQLLL